MLRDIARIKATPEAQPRVALHYPTVEQYRECLRDGVELDPVVVFFDETDNWLADGFHRLEAYRAEDRTQIPVIVKNGTKRDAILYSVGANAKHGLPRTAEDKRRAVMVLLGDPEWGQKSDRWIAETAAVSHTLVQSLRASTGNSASSTGRQGKDGRTRKLPERKSEPRREAPPASERVPKNTGPVVVSAPLEDEPAPPPEVSEAAVEAVDLMAETKAPSKPKATYKSITKRDTARAIIDGGRSARANFDDDEWAMLLREWDEMIAVREYGRREAG